MVENEWKKEERYLCAEGRCGRVHDRLRDRPISSINLKEIGENWRRGVVRDVERRR